MVYRHVVVVVMLIMKKGVSCDVNDAFEAKIMGKSEEVTAHLWCNNKTVNAMPLPPVKWNRITKAVVTGCSPDNLYDELLKNGETRDQLKNGIFAKTLSKHGIKPFAVKKLELKDVPENARFGGRDFENLDALQQLSIQATGSSRPEQLSRNFLGGVKRSLTFLKLENEALQPHQQLEKLGTVVLIHGRSLGPWLITSNHLKAIRLRDWIISAKAGQDANGIEFGWLACCEVLHFWAEEMELQSLKIALFGSRYLVRVELPNNRLTSEDLRDVLRDSSRLVSSLDVSRNNLTEIETTLNGQTQLTTLNLSFNMIHHLRRTLRSLHAVPSIRQLWIDHNSLGDFCDQRKDPVTADDIAPLRLQHMSLVGANISRLCFADWGSLYILNLTANNIEELLFGQLPLIGNEFSLTVDLRNNPLRRVHFNEPEYYALKGARKIRPFMINDKTQVEIGQVTVYTDPLKPFDCNCHNAWLARALRERRVKLSAGAHCRGGDLLSEAPPALLECDPVPCAPCRCHQSWKPRTMVVYCEALGLQEIPEQMPELGELHLKSNLIETIRVEDLPETLTLLDVSDNNVSRVDAATVAEMFRVTERRVLFAGNPLICECDNWPLLGALQTHSVQVEDYVNVTCTSGRALNDVSEEELCGTRRDIWVWVGALGGATVGLVALLGAVYARYDNRMKVWLYSRGWCLSCVREDELDTDREYDAFVSYAHGDHEFVADKLMPKLESDSCGYKVCVHYRDWTPGELIPTQIVRSVAASRRTVIILSTHFVQSVWGMLEFRTAHMSALAEGRVRVLVVALEDTPPVDELPEELRLYLRSTTYLRWDDPWFWDKFRYALPHRTRREVKCNARETASRATGHEAYHVQSIE